MTNWQIAILVFQGIMLAVTIIGMVGWYHRDRAALKREADADVNNLHGRLNDVREEIYKTRLASAQSFATVERLDKMENRLLAALEKLSGRIDNLARCSPGTKTRGAGE